MILESDLSVTVLVTCWHINVSICSYINDEFQRVLYIYLLKVFRSELRKKTKTSRSSVAFVQGVILTIQLLLGPFTSSLLRDVVYQKV